MTFTLTTSGAIVLKAGANASSTATSSGAFLEQLSDEAEALINATAGIDIVGNYSSLDTSTKNMLGDIASSYAAMSLVAYDMSGYTSLSEAETLLDVLNDRVVKGLALLKEDRALDILGAT